MGRVEVDKYKNTEKGVVSITGTTHVANPTSKKAMDNMNRQSMIHLEF